RAGRDDVAEIKGGVACYPQDNIEPHDLVQNAEAALKEAKTSGERYLHHRVEMNAELARRLSMEQRLRAALETDQFRLYYQPKIALRDGRVAGVEALLRWQDPETGLVNRKSTRLNSSHQIMSYAVFCLKKRTP